MSNIQAIIHNRDLWIIGASESVSNIGNWITMMAVFAMIVFKGDGGVLQSSGVFLAGLLPTLLFSPVAGWLSDRFDRKKLMIASELFSGVVILGLIFTTRLELIYALLALQAISVSVMTPTRQAVIPDIAGREALTSANAFLQQLSSVIKIAAPMLAGLVLAVMTPQQAIILDVISFGLSAFILMRLPTLRPHRDVAREATPGREDAEQPGIQSLRGVIKDSAQLRLLFVCMFLGIVVIIGFDILSPVYIRDVLGGDEAWMGFLIGLVGLGTLGATIMLMSRRREQNPWIDILSGLLLLASLPALLALAARLGDAKLARHLVILGGLLGGVGNGLLVVQISTLLQILSPAALLGRIGGVFQSTVVAGQLVGILLTPLLVPKVVSIQAYLGISATGLVLLVAYIGMLTRRTAAREEGRAIEAIPKLANERLSRGAR